VKNGDRDHILDSVPGMLLSHKRLMTYVYPLLLNSISIFSTNYEKNTDQ
jgi:hypothetical protein